MTGYAGINNLIGSAGRTAEPLQNYAFWLVDIAPVDAFALPIFLPTIGFKSITAPEVTVNTQEIREGNWYFSKKVVKNASVNRITLSKASRFYDSDFERWSKSAIIGNTTLDAMGWSPMGLPIGNVGGPTYRRTLMLIHFFSRVTVPDWAAEAAIIGGLVAGAAVEGVSLATGVAALAGMAVGAGPFDQVARLPAKAYVLYGCIPTRYKTASGFDATSSDVSLSELDIDYEYFEEISLAG